jgi:hypothetical protein
LTAGNGGIAGSDTRIITESEQRVDLSGMMPRNLTSNLVMQVLSFAQHGDVIVIMNNYALVSEHKTIHSSAQIESYKNKVDDRAPIFGGTACITTLEDYKIPMHFRTDSHTLICDLSQMMNFVTYLMYSPGGSPMIRHLLILRLTMNGTTPSLLFNHSLPKVNMMNVAIPSQSILKPTF